MNQQIEKKVSETDDVVQVLSLGSGNCDTEMRVAEALVKSGCTQFTIRCTDITKPMLERGAALAAQEGLSEHFSFEETDLNSWVPVRTYPVVMANQCLHHVQEWLTVADAARVSSTASRLNSALNFLRLAMTLLCAHNEPTWKCPQNRGKTLRRLLGPKTQLPPRRERTHATNRWSSECGGLR